MHRFRFASITPRSGASHGTLDLVLRGKPGEAVQLAYVVAATSYAESDGEAVLECQSTMTTIGADGTAKISLPPQ